MQCPTLKELPIPPSDKTGWPWAEDSRKFPDTMPDGSLWPRISIVTPSFNQSQYIEETIRSVLLQGYPRLEYMIIDGGSNDSSVDIIKKYEKWITYWISEPDSGQANAINKGIGRCQGEVFAWINSDDIYLSNSFGIVARCFRDHPKHIIAGDVIHFDNRSGKKVLHRQQDITLHNTIRFWKKWEANSNVSTSWHQPGLFFPTFLIKNVGLLDEKLTYSMDLDFLCRLLMQAEVAYCSKPFSEFRIHEESKTATKYYDFMLEDILIFRRYRNLLNNIDEDNSSLAHLMIKRAFYQLRSLHMRTFAKLFVYLWRTSPKHTVDATRRELTRLLLGGRHTGRM
jgi:glycosyltransferase involved in cell wall biosynthesis